MVPRRIVLAAAVAVLAIPAAQAAPVHLNLTPYSNSLTDADGNPVVGAYGLWLGQNFNFDDGNVDWHLSQNNFMFHDVGLTIFDNGDGLVSGNLRRMSDNSIWGLNINLRGLRFRNVEDRLYNRMPNFLNNVVQNRVHGQGIQWRYLQMSLTAPVGSSDVPTRGWVGKSMPLHGWNNPAVLMYDENKGGLSFQAWYQRPGALTRRNYRVGDTKGGTDPVPEPATALLIGAGLLAAGGARFRRKK